MPYSSYVVEGGFFLIIYTCVILLPSTLCHQNCKRDVPNLVPDPKHTLIFECFCDGRVNL